MCSSSYAKTLFRFCPVTPKGSLLESLSALSLLACISKFQLILIHSCFVLICSLTEMALFHPCFLPPFFRSPVLHVFLDHSHVPSWLLFCETKWAEHFSSPLKRQSSLFLVSPFIFAALFDLKWTQPPKSQPWKMTGPFPWSLGWDGGCKSKEPAFWPQWTRPRGKQQHCQKEAARSLFCTQARPW